MALLSSELSRHWRRGPAIGGARYGKRRSSKIRKPIAVILLSIITIGIYALFWQYASFKEIKAYAGTGIGGGVGLLLAIFVGFVNFFLLPAEVGNLYAADNKEKPISGLTGFWAFIPILGSLIWIVKTQRRLNEFWTAHGASAS
jgi:hypothetical protein